MNKKVLALLLTLCMLFTMVPVNVMAEEADGNGLTEMSLQDSSTDESTDISADDETVPENEGEENNNAIDLSGGSKTIETPGEYTVVANAATTNTLTVKEDATITLKNLTVNAGADASAISIESGNVTLIISGEVSLTGGDNGAGIYVAEGASVTIKDSGAGDNKLTAIGNAGADDADGAAGIGGTWANGNSGAITIDGATVIARGYGVHGSGIGSGSGKVVGEIKINDADVTAQGGYYADGAGTKLQSKYGKSDPEGGAAIGGGGKTASTIADITITGSTVVANGGSKAAGIGANFWCSCGTITISGDSDVTVQGGSSSAGIGTSRAGDTGVSAKIVISGGTVNATGGAYGAGIGGGYNSDSLGNGAGVSALPEISVTVSGGNVTATGGEGGAGIGGGYKTDNVDIDITGGTITAVTGALVSGKTVENGGEACAIGSGANGSGKFENSPAVEIGSAASITVTTEYGGKPAVEGMTDENANVLNNVVVTVNNAPAVTYVAQVGETKYETLVAAVEAAEAGATVTLLGNASGAGVVINKDVEIDLAGYTYTFTSGVGSTGTESNGFQILKDNTVKIMNGTLKVADEDAAKFYTLIQNYADLTLTDVTLDGTNLDKWSKTDGDSYTLSNNSGNIVIAGETNIIANNDGDKAFAFDVCKNGSYVAPTVTVETTGTITGTIEVTGGNLVVEAGTFTSEGDVFVVTSGKLTVNDATVTANTDGTGTANAIWANGGEVEINDGTFSVGGDTAAADHTHQNDAIYTKNGGKVVINGGEFLYTEGVWTLNENDANRGTITVKGGTFVGFNPANNASEGAGTSFVANGYRAVKSGDNWTVKENIVLSGAGTATDPYLITNLKELKAFRDYVNEGNTYADKYVKLTADIDLTGEVWTPIGTSNYDKTPTTDGVKMFAGNFDGGNHTITGLTSDGYVPDVAEAEKEYSFGLFGYVYGANISNVKLENVDIDCGTRKDSKGNDRDGSGVAALIGYYFPANEKTSVISNCHVLSGTVKASNNMGGLIGHMDSQLSQPKVDITIENCSNAANVTTEAREAGGILGLMNSAREGNYLVTMRGTVTFKNCVNTGDITSLGGGAPSAGGILGRDHNQAAGQRLKIVFDGCENSGTITVTANGETHAAGIGAGFYSTGAWLIAKDCNNTGNVVVNNSNSEVYAGGLISYGGVVELINSTSTGTVTGGTANNTYVGGAQNILFLEKMPNFTDTVNGYTYYLNGGTSPEYAALVDDAAGGGNFHLVETASKYGFEFGGWYDNAGFTGEAYTALNKNVKTYYAKWIGPVAKIGDTKYDTLQLAIDAVQAGETVTLITDVAEEIQIANNATVVLDLNGKTLTGCFKPFNGNLTVYGGTIDNNNGSYSAIEITAGTLDIKDVNITSTRHGVRIDGAVTATIDGGTYKVDATSGTRHAVNVSGAANVTIKNGTFIGPKGTAMDSGAAVMVQSGATVTIESGNFSGGKNNTLAADGTLTVKGGTFDQDPTAYVAKGYKAKDLGDGTYGVEPNMIFKLHLTDPTTGEPPFIPYIEGNDLASVVAKGKLFYANCYKMTLEILDDCEIDETVVIDYPMTIDLKGNTITGDGNVLPLIRIVGDADVTVKNGEIANDSYVFILGASDGSSAGNLTIESGKYTGETTVASVTKGTLTVLDGEFAVTNDATYLLNCIDANYKDGSAKIVVKGGTFYKFNPADNASEGVGTNFVAKGYKAVDNGNGTYGVEPNMIFEAHLVDANGEAHWLSPMRSNDLNALLKNAKVWYDSLQGTYDFTIKILEDCEIDETVVIDFPLTLDLGGKTITIADGKVLKTSGNLTVTGEGTIIGELSLTSATATLKAPADLTVTTNVENGIVKYIDGTYKVIPAVAKIGETIYETVSEALAEAAKMTGGATVTLLSEAKENYVIVTPGVTLDLNGNTLTANYIVGLNGSHVIDSSANNSGLLRVEKDNISLDVKNDQLPVWNGVDGYVFLEIGFNQAKDKDPDTGKDRFKFYFANSVDEDLLVELMKDNGTTDHEITVYVRVSWISGTDDSVTQYYEYGKTMILDYAAKPDSTMFTCILSNTQTRKDIKCEAVISSTCGVETASAVIEF